MCKHLEVSEYHLESKQVSTHLSISSKWGAGTWTLSQQSQMRERREAGYILDRLPVYCM